MGYCAETDLELAKRKSILIQLTDPGASVPSATVVALAIARADGEINGRIGVLYTTPITGSNLLKSLAIDITFFHLYGMESNLPQEIRKKYEDAIALLDKIGAGTVALDVSATTASLGVTISDPYNDTPDSGMVQPFHTLDAFEKRGRGTGRDPDEFRDA